jgi:hypothetical protein
MCVRIGTLGTGQNCFSQNFETLHKSLAGEKNKRKTYG